jgi:hypothetical protein
MKIKSPEEFSQMTSWRLNSTSNKIGWLALGIGVVLLIPMFITPPDEFGPLFSYLTLLIATCFIGGVCILIKSKRNRPPIDEIAIEENAVVLKKNGTEQQRNDISDISYDCWHYADRSSRVTSSLEAMIDVSKDQDGLFLRVGNIELRLNSFRYIFVLIQNLRSIGACIPSSLGYHPKGSIEDSFDSTNPYWHWLIEDNTEYYLSDGSSPQLTKEKNTDSFLTIYIHNQILKITPLVQNKVMTPDREQPLQPDVPIELNIQDRPFLETSDRQIVFSLLEHLLDE